MVTALVSLEKSNTLTGPGDLAEAISSSVRGLFYLKLSSTFYLPFLYI